MTVLVGRDGPVAVIEGAIDDALGAAGRFLLISGEAGIGKSRLADRAGDLATSRGMTVLRGYAVDDAGAPPLWPWLRPGQGRAPLLAALHQPVGGGDSDLAARFAMFMAVTEHLRALAEPQGMLLILEDLHWADRTSVLLLRHLAAELSGSRSLLVVTFRDTAGSSFGTLLPDLLRSAGSRTVRLGGLDSESVAAWLRSMPGLANWQAAAGEICERTAGNPLLIRMLLEGLPPAGERDAVEVLGRLLAERADLRALVTARLAGLSLAARNMIVAASVMAERIHPDSLALVLGIPMGDLLPLLTEAVTGGVLRPGADGLAFEHALLRDAVYGGLLPPERAHWHRRVAIGLEGIGESALAGPIAKHWQLAGGLEGLSNCLTWARVAARGARSALAYDEAVEFAELSMDCARRIGVADGEKAQLLLDLAIAQNTADLSSTSLDSCVAAAELAERADRVDLMAEAALVVQGVGAVDVYRVIRGLCGRALDKLPTENSPIRARLLAQVAVASAEDEGGPTAARLSAEALAVAEASGDPRAILDAIAARHLSITVPDTVVERQMLAARAVTLGARAGTPMAALWGHLWGIEAALQLGDLATADREIGEIDRIAQQRRSPIARWHHERLLATRSALIGDFSAARDHASTAFDLAHRMNDASTFGMYFAFESQLAVIRGDPSGITPGAWERLAGAPQIPLVRISVPIVLAITGEKDDAVAAFEEFRSIPSTFPVGTRWAATVSQIGVAAVLLDDREVAAEVYRLLLPSAHWCTGDGSGAVFSRGSNALGVGDLALCTGLVDEALRHYADAVAVNARLGARPFTALSRLGWARALHARLERGRYPAASRTVEADLAMSAKLATQAAAEFRRLDMPGPLATATGLLGRLAAGRKAANPLSERESEVAVLVADALSNREIADRLYLSERTVESHVRSILNKLALRTRTEVATWLIRAGDSH